MGSVGTNKTAVRDIRTITDENPKLNAVIEKAFRKANLIGENADLYQVMYSYKALREISQEDLEIIYDYLAERLGF